jgi:hypothetical protein
MFEAPVSDVPGLGSVFYLFVAEPRDDATMPLLSALLHQGKFEPK